MAFLYITEQNSILRKSGSRLILQKDEDILLEVQCHKIDAVLIFGNVQFTTQAVEELFKHGIEMAILSRTGRLKGQITSPATKNIMLRLKQFKKYWDEPFRLNISKSIVSGKIHNCLAMIRLFAYNHKDIDLKTEISNLQAILIRVEKTDSLEKLIGKEGHAARIYFNTFGKMTLGEFDFPGRKKRPPTDPINSILSLSYTMIFNEIASLLDGIGFDPYLGYLHSADYGRASLAADLMEEFRAPIADRLTLNLVNNRVFNQDDFSKNPKSGAISFKRDSLKRYFQEYEQHLNHIFTHPETKQNTSFRKCFRIQAEKLAFIIQNDDTYVPFSTEI